MLYLPDKFDCLGNEFLLFFGEIADDVGVLEKLYLVFLLYLSHGGVELAEFLVLLGQLMLELLVFDVEA